MPKKMTLLTHENLGLALFKVNRDLIQASVTTGIPRDLYTKLQRASKAINQVRSKMEDQLAKEYPDLTDRQLFACYYPGDKHTK